MPVIDLHNHTIFSYDGSNTPEEIIENAIRHNIDIIGISDHQFSIEERLGEYFERISKCKKTYEKYIRVLCGLEIGTRPKPHDLLATSTSKFDYVLFESLDSMTAMDFYEFLEWRRLFSCRVGLAHTDIFEISERYGLDVIKELRERNIFWEINISGNYDYYYDFITNISKQDRIRKSGIYVSVGSDTHWIREYRYEALKRANELVEKLGCPKPF